MANLKPTEILLIVLVVLLLFGAKRLPDLAKSVGKSLKILKSEVKDLSDDDKPASAEPLPPVTVVPPSAGPTEPYRNPVNHAQASDDVDRKQV